MRAHLGHWLGVAPGTLRFNYGMHGKPFLPGGPAFNLSHSGGLACLAIHPDTPLGVDIERFRTVEDGVAKRFFSDAEYSGLSSVAPQQRADSFFRCWTRKEAMVKAMGGGLSISLDAFDVTLRPDDPPRLTRLDPTHGHAHHWRLAHIDVCPDLVGALAARTGGANLRATVDSCPDGLTPHVVV